MVKGFSLTEVLVSLLLMTTASLALLKHQWQTSQWFHQMYVRAKALSVLDNSAEQFYVDSRQTSIEKSFKLQYIGVSQQPEALLLSSVLPRSISIKITWSMHYTMNRTILVG